MASPQYSTPVPSSAGFIHLILLQSLLLYFQCATPAMPIAQDHLFFKLNVSSVGSMARPPYSSPVPSFAVFIRLILLRSSSLIFRVQLLPRQLLRTVYFLMFALQQLVED